MRSLCKRRPFPLSLPGPWGGTQHSVNSWNKNLPTGTGHSSTYQMRLKNAKWLSFPMIKECIHFTQLVNHRKWKENGLGILLWASQVALVVKNPSVNAGDSGPVPGLEDPLEEEMATQSTTLAWEIPWTKEAGGLQSMGSQRAGHEWAHEHSILLKDY